MRKFNYTEERAEEIRVALKQDAKEQGKSMEEYFELEGVDVDADNFDAHVSTPCEDINEGKAQFILLTIDFDNFLGKEEGLTDEMIEEYVFELNMSLPYSISQEVRDLVSQKIRSQYGATI